MDHIQLLAEVGVSTARTVLGPFEIGSRWDPEVGALVLNDLVLGLVETLAYWSR